MKTIVHVSVKFLNNCTPYVPPSIELNFFVNTVFRPLLLKELSNQILKRIHIVVKNYILIDILKFIC